MIALLSVAVFLLHLKVGQIYFHGWYSLFECMCTSTINNDYHRNNLSNNINYKRKPEMSIVGISIKEYHIPCGALFSLCLSALPRLLFYFGFVANIHLNFYSPPCLAIPHRAQHLYQILSPCWVTVHGKMRAKCPKQKPGLPPE
jgi:hypothetical protein